MTTQPSKRKERQILSQLLVSKFGFIYANGTSYGYGKNYREAARNLLVRKKTMEIGMLVRIINPNGMISYWDGREFVKELKKGDKLRNDKN